MSDILHVNLLETFLINMMDYTISKKCFVCVSIRKPPLCLPIVACLVPAPMASLVAPLGALLVAHLVAALVAAPVALLVAPVGTSVVASLASAMEAPFPTISLTIPRLSNASSKASMKGSPEATKVSDKS